MQPRVREMLDLFELRRWEHELIESFSHGMKQRLVMSAAFLHRPRAVAVDEPMVGLDPRGARLIKDVFRRMSERGVAILMSTHTLEVAQEMCHRISIIQKGRIIAQGTVDEVRRSPAARRRPPDVGVPEADRRLRPAGDRRDRLMQPPFPYLLLPHVWASRNRIRRRERGDGSRAPAVRIHCRGRLRRALRGRVLADARSSPRTPSSATTCCAWRCRGCS